MFGIMLRAISWLEAHYIEEVKKGNQVGAIAIKGLIEGLILAFIGLMFLFQFIPQLEGEASTDNISNSFVASMGDMAVWVIPVLAIVGVLYLGFNFIRSGRIRGG